MEGRAKRQAHPGGQVPPEPRSNVARIAVKCRQNLQTRPQQAHHRTTTGHVQTRFRGTRFFSVTTIFYTFTNRLRHSVRKSNTWARHSPASHAFVKGIPLPAVAKMLGHSHAAMTLRYAHVVDREVEAAAKRVPSQTNSYRC